MENQEIYTQDEAQGAPHGQEPTTEHAMSRRRFLGAIGAITAAAATGVLTNACRRDEQGTGEQAEPRELSPEQEKEMIQILKNRSEAEKNKNLCPDLDWSRAKRALTPEVLLTVYKAELEKHEPTIYFSDETGFDIGTRTDETPLSTRNCVLDEKAAEPLRKRFPDLKSAVKSAEDMGFDRLMATDQGKHIVENTKPYYERDWSYYDTPEDIREAGAALFGGRLGYDLGVYRNRAGLHRDFGGWRGTLRVNFVD